VPRCHECNSDLLPLFPSTYLSCAPSATDLLANFTRIIMTLFCILVMKYGHVVGFIRFLFRWAYALVSNRLYPLAYEGVSKIFRTESITKYTLTTINTRWHAIQRLMASKLTRLTHKIAIQLHLVAESCTVCSSRNRRPGRKLLDTPLYLCFGQIN
jgi:hypothetical protein